MPSALDARETADPLGQAMLDYLHGEMGALTYRDGAQTRDGHVADYYFQPRAEWGEETVAFLERIESRGGPILDAGCGAGQHALWLQDRGLAVTGIDVSPNAVEAARERGLEDARVMDMFETDFERDRFHVVYALGTQIGLAGSFAGLRDLLAEFARITDEDGVAVVHNYDPSGIDGADDLLGYRPDPRTGVAHRCFHLEYEYESDDRGDGSEDGGGREKDENARVREIGSTLHFLLFGPDRLADATIGTPWTVADVVSEDRTYVAILEKADD
ncbi:class I SAM-dependent methyltransferase [Halobacteria archaeon AArc-m2/3/4]|uniref:Class I SAM-dependent methyltransferase n=1 Tax=Natronoglomus mannanivorans TaxID=2979990 RepID=A0ABT2QBF1_9EURY|nr:class I SAM-dependent methyltransferase [Halobacteria archaeon AArc-m2/3/4]